MKKTIIILLLVFALGATLYKTNPGMQDFAEYYENGEWETEKALLEKVPAVTEYFKEKEVRQDYHILSVYNFGGRLFLGVAGDFRLMA